MIATSGTPTNSTIANCSVTTSRRRGAAARSSCSRCGGRKRAARQLEAQVRGRHGSGRSRTGSRARPRRRRRPSFDQCSGSADDASAHDGNPLAVDRRADHDRGEHDRIDDEPAHERRIARRFAVGRAPALRLIEPRAVEGRECLQRPGQLAIDPGGGRLGGANQPRSEQRRDAGDGDGDRVEQVCRSPRWRCRRRR